MKRYKVSYLLLITLTAFVLVSITACSQPPEEEMAAAREAVEQAGANEDVREYALESLEQARQLLSEMESASENEDYDSARSLAGEARDAAEEAVQNASSAKATAQNRAKSAVADAITALEEARTALDDARDVPGIRFDFQATRRDLDASASEITAAESDLQDERFSEASTTAENARASISDVVRRISNAVRAASAK
ncbi:MAG: DUF4398 domain-containing protein [Alkalispirochaeta sp.]